MTHKPHGSVYTESIRITLFCTAIILRAFFLKEVFPSITITVKNVFLPKNTKYFPKKLYQQLFLPSYNTGTQNVILARFREKFFIIFEIHPKSLIIQGVFGQNIFDF